MVCVVRSRKQVCHIMIVPKHIILPLTSAKFDQIYTRYVFKRYGAFKFYFFKTVQERNFKSDKSREVAYTLIVLGGMALFIPVFSIEKYPGIRYFTVSQHTLFVIYTISKSCPWLTG